MSAEINVEFGAADADGFRTVVARCGEREYRDQFHPKDAVRRGFFSASALKEFGRPITAENISVIAGQVLRQTSGRAARRARGNVRARIERLSDVPACAVEWLWPGRVALGTLTLLAGDPGLGKSFVTLDMAARVSRGMAWPDEDSGRRVASSDFEGAHHDAGGELRALRAPASVVLLSAEDDLARTIRPRLDAMGADCTRIVTLQAIDCEEDGVDASRSFELARDLEQLVAVVDELADCRLVVIDPVSAYLGRTVENLNASVRALLKPLSAMAQESNLAIVLVTHLRKEEGDVMRRMIGSTAFAAAARTAWVVIRDRCDASRRLMLPVKNNLAASAGGLGYSIEPMGPAGAPIVCWSPDPVDGSLSPWGDDWRSPVRRAVEARQQVKQWLRSFLVNGEKPARVVREAAEAQGFSERTLRRAFQDLDGEAIRNGGQHGSWSWRLPAEPGAPDAATANTQAA